MISVKVALALQYKTNNLPLVTLHDLAFSSLMGRNPTKRSRSVWSCQVRSQHIALAYLPGTGFAEFVANNKFY